MFINPGTDTFPIQEAWARRRERRLPAPDPVMCTHEFTAVSAAHGYFMVSGRPQTVLVHVDAGTLNAGGALSNAQRANAGLVFCAGRAPYTGEGEMRGSKDLYIQWGQERLDQAGGVRDLVKWHYELARTENIGPVIGRAFQLAGSAPAGPVYLTLPREVLMQPATNVRLPDGRALTRPAPTAPDPDAVTQAARLLVEADRPLIVAGRCWRDPGALAELTALAEVLGARIVDTYEFSNVPASHPLYVGPLLERELPLADAVLFVDTSVPYVPMVARPRADAKVISLERDPVRGDLVNWEFPADVRLAADSANGLRALRQASEDAQSATQRSSAAERRTHITEERRRWLDQAQARARSLATAATIKPEWVAWCLKQVLPEKAILLEDAPTCREGVRTHLAAEAGGLVLTPGGSCLGWGINAGIGVKLARPESTVVSLVGDGGFIFGNPVAALSTAIMAGAPTLTVIFNNGGYRAAKDPVMGLYPGGAVQRLGDGIVTRIDPAPDYAAVASACGAYGATVREPAEVEATLRRDAGRSAARAARGGKRHSRPDLRGRSPRDWGSLPRGERNPNVGLS